MSIPKNLIRIRRRNRRIKPHNSGLRVGLSCSLILSLIFFAAILSGAWVYANITDDLPSPQELSTLLEPSNGKALQPTKIYDRSGTHLIAELNNPVIDKNIYLTSNPKWLQQPSADLEFQNIPPILILTTLAASDPGFWNHPGITFKGFFTDENPTLAQRLVDDFLLWQEPPGIRKSFRERLLAVQITSLFGREKILEWFINYADYGNYTVGAAAASKAYLNKDAGKLTLTEAAIIAATAEAPLLNPWDAPKVASERGQKIVQSMIDQGWASQEQVVEQSQEAFFFTKPDFSTKTIAPDFIDYTLSQLDNKIDLKRVKHGGFRIITTLDYDLQLQSECTASTLINQLHGIAETVQTASGEECMAARLLPTLAENTSSEGNSTKIGLVVIDPQKGQILALTSAGFEPDNNWFPAAYSANPIWQKHSSGTVMTPLIYLAALTRGYTLSSLVWDIPPQETLPIPNPDNKYHGPMRMRIAMANDYLKPAMDLLSQIGMENVKTISNQFGIPSDNLPKDMADFDSLLSMKTSLMEISQFYAALANQGNSIGWLDSSSQNEDRFTHIKPAAILSVEDKQGHIWINQDNETTEKSVITPQLAYLINNALSDKSATWQTMGHPNVLEVGFQTAAKQGKSYSDDGSAWTVGYTPNLLVGVWSGKENQTTTVSSPNIASSLWRAIIQYAAKSIPPTTWEVPAGISNVLVCDLSGMLPTSNCPASVKEVFLAGTEPTEPDNLFRSLEVNKETGLLATVFTPADFIEKKVFINFPPEAMNWAISSGFEVAPNSYDIISPPNASDGDAVILSPKIFSYVSGTIDITGTAAGDGFQYYRLQVGKGVNPSQWLQIGEDISKPVFNGELMKWNTGDLEGLYAIQLTVVRNDNLIENAFSQVTVDNQPPEISITYPQTEQEIDLSDSGTITFRLDINDNLGIEHVNLSIDNKALATLYQSPFAYTWNASKGAHTLSVEAIDMAGNVTEASVDFKINP